MNLGAPELLIVLIGLVPLALSIWGIVDAASRPEWAWQRAGQSKVLWIVLQVVGIFVCLGWILSIVYLASIRPQVAQNQQGPPSPW
jgi:Protein of unknown function (DUF2516)